jgi:hypothetical protein
MPGGVRQEEKLSRNCGKTTTHIDREQVQDERASKRQKSKNEHTSLTECDYMCSDGAGALFFECAFN